MDPEFAYFLKVNVAFALFYAFYRLCFYRDTFFKMRRFVLLAFFLLAFVYPLLNIQNWMIGQKPIVEMVSVYATIMLPEVTATAAEPASTNWALLILGGLYIVYAGVIVLLVFRFILRLGSICWLAQQSKRTLLLGVEVYALPEPAGPFSFFRCIFLHPAIHSEKETDEILTHERTHVSQWHSIDVVLSELICICCWFNPFVWLLKREVRHNLEYLADNRVIQSGYDSRNYQYHLLGLAHHHPDESGLYNSFNVLHIKNRIRMMNKKRTHGIGRTKYLFLLPFVVSLMILNNINALARMTNMLPLDTAETTLPDIVTTTSSNQLSTDPLSTDPLSAAAEGSGEKPIFVIVEEQPSFPGGVSEMLSYLQKTITYPVEAQTEGVEGRVVCSFIVTEEGSIQDIEVVRGIHPSLDMEAVRVVSSMPTWEPGRQRGKAVSVKYTLPIVFRLSNMNHSGQGAKAQTINQTEEAFDSDEIFSVVDRMPLFPGGEIKMMGYLSQNIKYPVVAMDKGIQGRVISSFIVNKDGSLSNVDVVRGVDQALDREAIRVISSMPKWMPGSINGKAVRTKFILPVVFRIQ